jgi:addiction module RelE/StbE family toxin
MGLKQHKVVISQKAQNSIREIYEYVKEHSSVFMARKVRDAIISKAKSLHNFAGYATDRFLTEIGQDYRSVTVWDYLIIYRVEGDRVLVLNVIHSKMHPINRSRF